MAKISDELAEVVVGFEGFHEFNEVLEKLADLIEPDERTCHMRDTRWDDGQCTWGCICSECGARHEHNRGKWLNYCPNCGARNMEVVENEQ